ncbi:unnamed protein product [Echinostoma caproni]|uniref:Uncharacterized protein n=1 Tax=Echinostoma caproni TaxID=27848 RepID=A0A183BDN1_9TREM|nr:unnamed protein product [Echinostoma caproni]
MRRLQVLVPLVCSKADSREYELQVKHDFLQWYCLGCRQLLTELAQDRTKKATDFTEACTQIEMVEGGKKTINKGTNTGLGMKLDRLIGNLSCGPREDKVKPAHRTGAHKATVQPPSEWTTVHHKGTAMPRPTQTGPSTRSVTVFDLPESKSSSLAGRDIHDSTVFHQLCRYASP